MRIIKAKKTELLAALKSNMDKHESYYLIALNGWRKETSAILNANRVAMATDMATLDTHGPIPDDFELAVLKRVEPKPDNHVDDYARAIQMLNMHIEDTIEMDETEFRQYVQDEWDWKQLWSAVNAKYTSANARR